MFVMMSSINIHVGADVNAVDNDGHTAGHWATG